MYIWLLSNISNQFSKYKWPIHQYGSLQSSQLIALNWRNISQYIFNDAYIYFLVWFTSMCSRYLCFNKNMLKNTQSGWCLVFYLCRNINNQCTSFSRTAISRPLSGFCAIEAMHWSKVSIICFIAIYIMLFSRHLNFFF